MIARWGTAARVPVHAALCASASASSSSSVSATARSFSTSCSTARPRPSHATNDTFPNDDTPPEHHRSQAGGFLDPFLENSNYGTQDPYSSSYDLPESNEWPPRGSDLADSSTSIPQRERKALSSLFAQFEQRHAEDSNALPEHSTPNFSHLGRAPQKKHEASLRMFAKARKLKPPQVYTPYRELLRETSSVSAEQVNQTMRKVKTELTGLDSDLAVWNWAETNVFASPELQSQPGPYGMYSPYYSAVLVELIITLRDRLRSPHLAIAL